MVGCLEAGQRGVAVGGLQPALRDQAFEARRHAVDDGCRAGAAAGSDDHVEAGIGDDFGQTGPHDPRADDADTLDVSHGSTVVTHG